MPNNDTADILEAKKRLESLPENLKKEMLADKNAALIYSICQDYKIADEDLKKVALLVGEVFLGYIKPEEVASELNKYFGVELQKSNFIEIELKQKIFNGLKADLDKIYNPIKIEESEEKTETSPTIIKLESEAAPITKISSTPLQKPLEVITEKEPEIKISPLNIGNVAIQPTKTETPAMPKTITEQAPKEDAPFIIQTKVEAVKAAIPQFPKETPSLILKVDPSIIQKNPIAKPISIHLETTQPAAQEKRFQMPVIAGQKIFSAAPIEKTEAKPITEQVPQTILGASQNKSEIAPRENISNLQTPSINIQKPIIESKKADSPEIKTNIPITEALKTPIFKPFQDQSKEPVKTVHYSTFKTDLTPLGTPKKPEQKKEDFINLNTFTKISGNTVDLRKSS